MLPKLSNINNILPPLLLIAKFSQNIIFLVIKIVSIFYN
jgi:hypothetical protein